MHTVQGFTACLRGSQHCASAALHALCGSLQMLQRPDLTAPCMLCTQDEKSWVLAMKELHKINSYKVPLHGAVRC